MELFGSETVAKEKGVHDIVKMAVAEYVDSFYLEHKAREATNKAYRGEFFPPDTYTSRAALSLNNYCRAYTNHVSNRTESALEDICPGNPEDAYYLHCQIIKVVRACELSFPHGTGIKPNPPASFQVEPGKTFAQQHLSDIRKYWHQEQDDAKYWKDDLNEKDALRVTGWQQKEDAREKTAKEHGNPDGPGFF